MRDEGSYAGAYLACLFVLGRLDGIAATNGPLSGNVVVGILSSSQLDTPRLEKREATHAVKVLGGDVALFYSLADLCL